MAELVFYHAIPSRGLVVHWMLEELGVPFTMHVLDLAEQEHKQAEYLAINPLGRVPSLQHGDNLVTETTAIVAYLAETFPEAGLDVPAGTPDRADYLRWMHFSSGSGEPAVAWAMLGEEALKFAYQPFATAAEVATALTQTLEGKQFIVANRFTAADVVIGSMLNWGLNMVPSLPKNPVLTDYWDRLAQRPAWQRVADTF